MAHTVDDVSTFQDTQILTDGRPALYELTPSQEVTFSKLLCIGGPRPFSPPGLDVELSAADLISTTGATTAPIAKN